MKRIASIALGFASLSGAAYAHHSRAMFDVTRNRGRHEAVTGSGHFIQKDHPEAVIEAVREVIHEASLALRR